MVKKKKKPGKMDAGEHTKGERAGKSETVPVVKSKFKGGLTVGFETRGEREQIRVTGGAWGRTGKQPYISREKKGKRRQKEAKK